MIVHGEGERYEVHELTGYNITGAASQTEGMRLSTDVFVVDNDYAARVVYAQNARRSAYHALERRRLSCRCECDHLNREHLELSHGSVA